MLHCAQPELVRADERVKPVLQPVLVVVARPRRGRLGVQVRDVVRAAELERNDVVDYTTLKFFGPSKGFRQGPRESEEDFY